MNVGKSSYGQIIRDVVMMNPKFNEKSSYLGETSVVARDKLGFSTSVLE